jgi:hypothetical protein
MGHGSYRSLFSAERRMNESGWGAAGLVGARAGLASRRQHWLLSSTHQKVRNHFQCGTRAILSGLFSFTHRQLAVPF